MINVIKEKYVICNSCLTYDPNKDIKTIQIKAANSNCRNSIMLCKDCRNELLVELLNEFEERNDNTPPNKNNTAFWKHKDGKVTCSHCGETACTDAEDFAFTHELRYFESYHCPHCGYHMVNRNKMNVNRK